MAPTVKRRVMARLINAAVATWLRNPPPFRQPPKYLTAAVVEFY
jgi:hypothetical protein